MRWEYRTLKFETTGFKGGKFDEAKLDEALNTLGADSWELIKTFDTTQDMGATRAMVFVFKRPAA